MGDAAGLTQDKFENMIKQIDKDGDGSVDKAEFKIAYKVIEPDITDPEFDKIWAKIDADGDGNLTVNELATFFGYNLEDSSTNEMTDEQILQVLMMQNNLNDVKPIASAPADASADKSKKEKDKTITIVNYEKDQKKEGYANLCKLLECCVLGDLESKDPEADTITRSVDAIVKEGKSIRIQDKDGKMPLHHLCRHKAKADKDKDAFKRVFQLVLTNTKTALEALPEKKTLFGDVNHQDNDGKTPLFYALEFGNTVAIDALFDLRKQGPDVLLVNAYGWTAMHAAVQTDNLDILKQLVNKITDDKTGTEKPSTEKAKNMRIKTLLCTPDKMQREPLHIAAYKCSEEMVTYLKMELAAPNTKKDSAGNTAGKLAGNTGRRKSREIIDGLPGGTSPQSTRRKSKEMSAEDAMAIAAVAAPAAAAPAAAPAAS